MEIGIVGLGLIGGSFGRAIKKKTKHKVYAFDVSDETIKKGKLLDAYDEVLTDNNVHKLDLILFALYPKTLEEAINDYAPKLKDGCIVMDLCGNKTKPVEFMKKLSKKYTGLKFVGAHPMAGREFSGVAHSTASLYENASLIVVPVTEDLSTLKSVKDFALEIGFKDIVFTTAEEHDRIIAYTSQLAHLVSSSYIKSPTVKKQHGFSAGSFRDMTRVARLSPQMWTGLMIDNAKNISEELGELIKHLQEYKDALDSEDSDKLFSLLEDGNQLKLEDLKNQNRK